MGRRADGTGPPTKQDAAQEETPHASAPATVPDGRGKVFAFSGKVGAWLSRCLARAWVRSAAIAAVTFAALVLLGALQLPYTPLLGAAVVAVVVASSTTLHRQLAYVVGAAAAWAAVAVAWAAVSWVLASRTGLMCENPATGYGRQCTSAEAFEWVFFAAMVGVIAAAAKPVVKMSRSLLRKVANASWYVVLAVASATGFAEPKRPSRQQVAVFTVLVVVGYSAAVLAGFERIGALMVAAVVSTMPVLWSVGTTHKQRQRGSGSDTQPKKRAARTPAGKGGSTAKKP
jgi:hypothetical protein